MKLREETNSTAAIDRPLAVPQHVLETLAARFRSGGLFVLAANPDGSIAWHDPAANAFFLRYVLPLLQQPTICPAPDPVPPATLGVQTITIQHNVPGVLVASVPCQEKRQPLGRLLIASRTESFDADDRVQTLCTRLELDNIALQQLAIELPGYDEPALQRQSKIMLACLRDQLRLCGLEQEVTSISEQLASTYEELTLIYQVSGGMKVNRSAGDFFRQICQDVIVVMGTRGVGVALDPATCPPSDPVIYGQARLSAANVKNLGDDLVGLFRDRKGALVLNDLSAQTRFPWLHEHASQLLAAPLQRSDKTFGCLFALDKESGDFDSTDANLLTSIANECAIYLENAQLFSDVHGLMMGLLHSLTSAVDAKDAYTCGHSERVALLSRHLAQQIGLCDREVEQIYMAGLLHDVGKIGVPESVLQKTGRLTNEEFEQMKKHPEIGARILQDVRQVKDLIPGVLHHHERYDGRGYPHGVAGQDIPLMGRIICLADSFDAMTSNRTYRQALPLEVALAEICRCSGTHFDPELAEFFLHTAADNYRELLHDHQGKAKKLLHMHQDQRSSMTTIVTAA